MMRHYLRFLYVLIFLGPSNTYGDEYPKIWNIPSHNKSFTGRHHFLKLMEQELSSANNSILAIVGPPGVGKTQITKRYAELNKNKYDIIWWIDGDRNIIEQYRSLAVAINNNDNRNKLPIYASEAILLEQLKNYLRVSDHNWLLIFDNSKDEGSITEYIPTKHNKSRGNILISSKSSTTWRNMMKLEIFNRPESLEYLKKELRSYKTSDDKALDKLADLLGDYPLALSQAIACMNNTEISVEEYIKIFEAQRIALWEKEKQFKDENNNLVEFDHYKGSVFTSLALSINDLKTQSPAAFDLLVLCSLLDNEMIPGDFLSFASKLDKQDKLNFVHHLAKLKHYSILKQNHITNQSTKATYSMHGLIQLVVLDLLDETQQKQYLAKAQRAIAEYLPDQVETLLPVVQDHPSLFTNIKKMNFHVNRLQQFNDNHLTILMRLLEYYTIITFDHKAALELITEITDKAKTTKMSDLLLAQFHHAKCIYSAWYESNREKSIIEAKQAIKLLDLLPERKDDILNAYLQLAQVYLQKCDVDSAMIYLDKAELVIKSENKKSIKTGLFHLIKSKYEMNKGNFEKALQEDSLAIEFKQNVDINGNAMCYIPFYILEGDILLKNAKYQEALDKTTQMLIKVKDFYQNEEHILLFSILVTHSGAALKLGKLELAKNSITKAMQILKKSYKDRNVSAPNIAMANTLIALGDVQAQEKEYLNANESYLESETIFKTLFVDAKTDDVSYLYSRLVINGINLNDHFQAEYYQTMHKDRFGDAHPRSNEIIEYLVAKDQ